jgi:polyphosphate kinase 2
MAKDTRSDLRLTPEDIELLNSKIGMKHLFASEKTDVELALKKTKDEIAFRALQEELIKLQDWVINEGKKVVILFEGRDGSGKSEAIRRITAHINPRHYRIVALPKPADWEAGQWYFQRYIQHLPHPGEIVFFDRSWYNRAGVEPINGFCTQKDYEIFMGQVNEFERMLIESDTYLIKLYLSITKEEQDRRFKEMQMIPYEKWNYTELDRKAQEMWDVYTEYKVKMFDKTDTEISPWVVLDANDKAEARRVALRYILSAIPYKG